MSLPCSLSWTHRYCALSCEFAGGGPEYQNSENDTALHTAVQQEHADVVQVLIDAGADIETKNDDGHSPLHLASISGELITVKMLVEAGADVRAVDAYGNTCLILAANHGHTDTVRYLVGLPEVDLNHQEYRNFTALHFAVQEKHGDVQVLIDAGADIETKDANGCSPLHVASISGELATVKMLVEAGADVRATDDNRHTCLIIAADCGHTDTVRYLVSLPEVDLNHQDTNNCTALHFAVQGKHPYVVERCFRKDSLRRTIHFPPSGGPFIVLVIHGSPFIRKHATLATTNPKNETIKRQYQDT